MAKNIMLEGTQTIEEIAESFSFLKNSARAASVSDKYNVYSTPEIAAPIEALGYRCVNVSYQTKIDENKQQYAKHLLRFRAIENIAPAWQETPRGVIMGAKNDCADIILVNSHDGACSYSIMLGWYRCACANGLIVGQAVAAYSIRHTTDISRVHEVTRSFNVNIEKVTDSVERMKDRSLTYAEREDFSRFAYDLKFKRDEKGGYEFQPIYLAQPRRRADSGDDLFTVFNVIQENIVRGSRIRNAGRRAVSAIDRNIELNRALWDRAESYLLN